MKIRFKPYLRRLIAGAAALAIAFVAQGTSSPASAQATQVPPAEVCFQATTGVNGMVGTLGAITGGSGGTAGAYPAVPLTGGSGSGATANITVAGGAVTAVSIVNPGANYVVGDALSALSASIGSVSGFSFPVNSISINSSLAGGTVGMYTPGTLAAKQTWANSAQTILNSNPIQLDQNGCAIIYGAGTYRQIVYDALGNEVWDQLTSVNPVNPYWAGSASGTANSITVIDGSFSATDGQSIGFIAIAPNTGPGTLNPSGYGAINIYKNSASGTVPLVGGEIVAGNSYAVTYSAVNSAFIIQNPTYINNAAYGQVHFSATSTTSVVLSPMGGNLITVAGTNYSIPAGGISGNIFNTYVNGTAAQSLTPNTVYYVYVFNNAGVLTLNFSTTGHATDTTAGNVGVEIMAVNNAYTLVGMVYPLAGPALAYTGFNSLVLSWFNRSQQLAQATFSTNRTSTSTTAVEINSEIRCQYLLWGSQPADFRLVTSVGNDTNVQTVVSYIVIDGVNFVSTPAVSEAANANQQTPASLASMFTGPYTSSWEGVHYVTMFGLVSGGTGKWYGPGITSLQSITNG